MKVLIIDDDNKSIMPLEDELQAAGYETAYQEFPSDIIVSVINLNPDFIVLDLKDKTDAGSSSIDMSSGLLMKERIWSERFIPVLIYSAFAQSCKSENHPFIGYVNKGSGSEVNAMEWIESKKPFLEAFVEIQDHVSSIQKQMLKSVVEYFNDGEIEKGTLKHLAIRRIAASLDQCQSDSPLPANSIYITPPISDFPRMSDIIKNVNSETLHIILTPSCDLGDEGQGAKIENVLIAKCEPLSASMRDMMGLSTKQSKLAKQLTQWNVREFFVLPSIQNKFPDLIIDMKKIEIVNIASIGSDYVILASIDSPYREKIAWAFIQQIGRPGVPGVDYQNWANELLNITRN